MDSRVTHDRAPKSTPSREQLKIDLRMRCEKRLRESLSDSRRLLMQMRRDGESILSPSSMIDNGGEEGIGGGDGGGGISGGDGRVHFQGSSVVSNMLHEIIADEVMHTPITGRHRIGLSKHLVTALNDIEEDDDNFPDPLSDNELFEILLEIEASVLREQYEEGPEELVSETNNGMILDSDIYKKEEEEEWDRQEEEELKRLEEEEEYYARLACELASDKDDR
jgi:hypothetical protein